MSLTHAIDSLLFRGHSETVSISKILLVAIVAAITSFFAFDVPPGGNRDFVGYWLATRSFLEGENPYDLSIIQNWRDTHNFDGPETLVVWNGPFSFLAFAPLMLLPLKAGAAVWFGFNIFAAALVVRLWWPGQSAATPNLVGLLVVAGLFVPVWFIFSLGQISLVLLLSASVAVWLIEQRRDSLAGLALVPLAIKPHLFFLFAAFVALFALRNKRLRILLSCAAGLALLSLSAEVLHPGIHQQWIGSKIWPPHLIGNSLVVPLWYFLSSLTGQSYMKELLTLLPLTGLLVLLGLVLRFSESSFNARSGYLLALALTPLFTPYGFIFDHAILLPLLVVCFATASPAILILTMIVCDAFIFAIGDISIGKLLLLWYLPAIQVWLLWALVHKNQVQRAGTATV